ncbi:MAG: ShlB/FhaC/HecB family hemolysin secretion/activation protein [Chlorobiaceae bacterium]|nr:ShlB/FhaC/HecB family hemolysin secretion/activation protein [Chlorobiaceae bacterium]
MVPPTLRFGLTLLCAAVLVPTTHLDAAVAPDAGTIMRDMADQFQKIPESAQPTALPQLESDASAVSPSGNARIMVRRFRISGATRFPEAQLLEELRGYTGRELTLAQLQEAAQSISRFYARHGYLARTVVPEQDVKDDTVTIQVIESLMGKVVVVNTDGARICKGKAASYVTGAQKQGEQIRFDDLERGLLLLQQTPGVRSSATVRRGEAAGTSDVMLKLEKEPLLNGSLGYDNYGGRFTGEHRGHASLQVNSPLKIGDQLSLKGMYTDGITYGRVMYSLPVGSHGLRAGISLAHLDYTLGSVYKPLDATGESNTGGAFVSMPLILKRRSTLQSSFSYEHRHFVDRIFGLKYGDKTVQCGSIAISGGMFDDLLGGGYTTLGAMISIGDLDLSAIPSVELVDNAWAKTSGTYEKLSLSMSRVQQLFGPMTRLSLSMAGQIASKNLDSSEKFSLGGPNGVRAFPLGEGSGDEGLLLTVELRRVLSGSLQLFSFYDYGTIRRYANLTPTIEAGLATPNRYSLSGIGAGVLFMPLQNLSIKGTVATRVASNPAADIYGNDHDGTRREPRFWVEASYLF